MSRDEILRKLEEDEVRRRNVTKAKTWEDRTLEIQMDITRKLVTAFAKVWHINVDKHEWTVEEFDRGGIFNQIIGTFRAVVDDEIVVRVRVLPSVDANKPIPRQVWVNDILVESGDDLRRALGS